MRAAILASALVLAAMPALASDKTDVLATVKAYTGAFNKGDSAAVAAFCTPQAVIIDDFAPHVWQGPTACTDWAAGLAAVAKAAGDTDAVVSTAKPLQVIVTGDRAYAVFPAKYIFKEKGKPVTEPGIWTFTFQKLDAGWRISGWAWARE
jgi:ketosteroid isomerase-like protein